MPKRKNPDRGELLALALAEGQSVAEWARANNVNVRAAYRLAARPAVRAKATELRARLIDTAIGHLARGARSCAIVLWGTAADPDQPIAVRVSAASRALSALVQLETHASVPAQFAELKQMLEDVKTGKRKGKR
jgi:hypothetical protein